MKQRQRFHLFKYVGRKNQELQELRMKGKWSTLNAFLTQSFKPQTLQPYCLGSNSVFILCSGLVS